MTDPKFDAIRGALYAALENSDEPETRRLVREALQLLVALEGKFDDSESSREVDDAGARRQDPSVRG